MTSMRSLFFSCVLIGGVPVLIAAAPARADSPLPCYDKNGVFTGTAPLDKLGHPLSCSGQPLMPSAPVPSVAPPRVPSAGAAYQNSLAISGAALNMGLGYLSQQRAEQAAQAQADAAAADAERDARDAERRRKEAEDDAMRRSAMPNVFAGGQGSGASSNPFASQDGAALAGSAQAQAPFTVGAAGANPFAPTSAAPSQADPANSPPPRKLGDPGLAAQLAPMTLAACEALKPRSDVIRLPGGRQYCTVEVDQPEPTNEWHYLVEDDASSLKPGFKIVPPVVSGPRG
jgi:Flp pilus assembly protein TadG